MSPLLIDDLQELVVLDKQIDAAEDHAKDSVHESLRDRWEFGQRMLAKRHGRQLPNGYLGQLASATRVPDAVRREVPR